MATIIEVAVSERQISGDGENKLPQETQFLYEEQHSIRWNSHKY